MSTAEMSELKVLLQELKSEIKNMDDKQDVMMADIKTIKDVVYNPENGLYARVRDLEQWKTSIKDYEDVKDEVRDLRNWKEAVSKVLWSGGLSIIALIAKTIIEMI